MAIDALEDGEKSKACPLSPGLITCAMSKAKREKLIADMTEKAEALRGETCELIDRSDSLVERGDELKALVRQPSKAELEKQIATLESELSDMQPETSTVDIKAQIGELAQRVQKGEEILAEINREEGARQIQEKLTAEREKLEQTVGILEHLVEVLSPKGLPGKILSETIGPIEAKANARLSELTGARYQLELILDPDFTIFVTHDGVRIDLKRLSSSERQRIGIVLQDAIVQLSGLRFLIIDNADILDPDNRALLMECLLAMADDYDQIIVLSTIGPAGVTNPHIQGVGVYELEDGQLKEVA
jgi:DNA repair exonuclease SbcCD ATPase subunit